MFPLGIILSCTFRVLLRFRGGQNCRVGSAMQSWIKHGFGACFIVVIRQLADTIRIKFIQQNRRKTPLAC